MEVLKIAKFENAIILSVYGLKFRVKLRQCEFSIFALDCVAIVLIYNVSPNSNTLPNGGERVT